MFYKTFYGMVGIFLCFHLWSCVGCVDNRTEINDPKKRLSDYISKSFEVNKPEDRKELIGFLTGQAKNRLSAWNDDQFRQAFIVAKRKFLRLGFSEIKNLSPHEVSITYELSYIDQAKGKNAKITNKKSCQMVQESGQWYIADVHNMKELIEYQNELTLP